MRRRPGQRLALARCVVQGNALEKGEPDPVPDVIWTIFGDPANRGMLALMLAGLAFIMAGPWAIVRVASRGVKKGRG